LSYPEISYEHRSEGAVTNALGANSGQRPGQIYSLSNGKVRKLAQRMLTEILDRFKSLGNPDRAEAALNEGIRIFIRVLAPTTVAEAVHDVISDADAIGMAAFLANLGTIDDEASESARRSLLALYKDFANSIIRSGAQDGLDSLDEWAERRAKRAIESDTSMSA
jgi:hypothetical protein